MLHNTETHNNNRLYGLDTLRAIAIIIVLIYHYQVVISIERQRHSTALIIPDLYPKSGNARATYSPTSSQQPAR